MSPAASLARWGRATWHLNIASEGTETIYAHKILRCGHQQTVRPPLGCNFCTCGTDVLEMAGTTLFTGCMRCFTVQAIADDGTQLLTPSFRATSNRVVRGSPDSDSSTKGTSCPRWILHAMKAWSGCCLSTAMFSIANPSCTKTVQSKTCNTPGQNLHYFAKA